MALTYLRNRVFDFIFTDELDQYFEGGMEDMAAWTRLAWDTTLWMAANGPENCHIEHNPLNMHCPKGRKSLFSYRLPR